MSIPALKYMGNYPKALDAKGRVKLPPKFIEELKRDGDSTVVLTPNLDGGVNIYTQDEYERLAQVLINLPKASEENRLLSRFFISESFACKIDGQHRIKIPVNHLQAAGLVDEKQVVVAGAGSFIQLWNPDVYRQSLDRAKPALTNVDLPIQI